tara:strand:- start:2329 stop:3318 length:990 start_codon:yes stop_codon:yes gene_type:complete
MRPSEFDLIGRYFAPLSAGFPGAVNLQDDLATVSPAAGYELAVTVDAMVAGVHFLPADPPDLIARKLLRVNLSDLAASGARPLCYLLAISLDSSLDEDWVRIFADGLAHDQKQFGISLAGGDTTATPGPLTLSLTAIGEIPSGRAIRRSGAVVGDDIWLSGTVGDAALALTLMEHDGTAVLENDYPRLLARYRLPEPRTLLGPALIGVATAMADVSDGLLADLGHICDGSGTGARIIYANLPLSEAATALFERTPAKKEAYVQRVLTGGDDYELLFTAAPAASGEIERSGMQCGTRVTRIGQVEEAPGVRAVASDGTEIAVTAGGWRHF